MPRRSSAIDPYEPAASSKHVNLSKETCWWIVLGCAVLLVILTFTPLVTPIGVHEPALLGMPYTLWTGLIVAIGFVVLTLAATHCYPFRPNEEKEDL